TASEAYTHVVYRDRVIAASAEDAVYTMCFDGGWPDAAHRAIRNSTLTAWEKAGRPSAPYRPGEGDVVATAGTSFVHVRYGDLMPLPGMSGDLEAMALYAGQATGLIRDVAPAADIIARIVRDASEVVSTLSRLGSSAAQSDVDGKIERQER